jgi:hypothetical protein
MIGLFDRIPYAPRIHTPMAFPNSDLTNANQRVAEARERLDLQRDRIQNLRAGRHDTNDAEAVFRILRRTLETLEGRRHQIEDELVRAAKVRNPVRVVYSDRLFVWEPDGEA